MPAPTANSSLPGSQDGGKLLRLAPHVLLPLREHVPHVCSRVSAALPVPEPLLRECPPSPLFHPTSFLLRPKAKFKCCLLLDSALPLTPPPA